MISCTVFCDIELRKSNAAAAGRFAKNGLNPTKPSSSSWMTTGPPVRQHARQIELANGGVLFLDEVTEMSLAAQAKFLRVLQEREFQRLGGTRVQKANIRVIAATNRDLRKAVERGDFREDLFYRLKVFDIAIAPLRDRAADILPLGEALLQDIAKSFARPPAGLTRDAREALLRYH
jgi:transcriptional regulator with PAS, ATPase and Fis domain